MTSLIKARAPQLTDKQTDDHDILYGTPWSRGALSESEIERSTVRWLRPPPVAVVGFRRGCCLLDQRQGSV